MYKNLKIRAHLCWRLMIFLFLPQYSMFNPKGLNKHVVEGAEGDVTGNQIQDNFIKQNSGCLLEGCGWIY